MSKLSEKIFSIKINGIHKIITLLGLKLKTINKQYIKNYITDLERRNYTLQMNEDVLCEADKPLLDYLYGNKLLSLAHKMKPRKLDAFHLEINIVDHCNLNCQCCDHFSPLAQESYLDINEFERDIKQLAGLTPAWSGGTLALLGGEALLHKDIVKFFEISRKYLPKITIILVSNGILLKNNDKIFKALKKYNIKLDVTTYDINIDYKAIDKMAKKYKIFYNRVCNVDKGREMWRNPFDLDGKPKEFDYIKCYHYNTCHVLRHGKIYTCPIIPYSEYFNKYFNKNLEVSPNDYIDIYKVKGFDEISEFCAKKPDFCRYCDVNKRKTYKDKYAVSKKIIEEWT